MSNSTIVDWKSFLRDICAEHFIDNPVQLGGPGMTVEIDESVFTRRKYNRGRMVREQWVFGQILLLRNAFLCRWNVEMLLPCCQLCNNIFCLVPPLCLIVGGRIMHSQLWDTNI